MKYILWSYKKQIYNRSQSVSLKIPKNQYQATYDAKCNATKLEINNKSITKIVSDIYKGKKNQTIKLPLS